MLQTVPRSSPVGALTVLVVGLLLGGCSVKKLAVNEIGNALAGSGTTFASDNDPDLIRDAIPFTLKLVESVLAESPDHIPLRTAAAAYFTQYAYGFLQLEADYAEWDDFEQADHLRARAKKLFLRGREHGLTALEQAHPGFRSDLQRAPVETVGSLKKSEIELIYWTAAAWASAIALSIDDPYLVAEVPQMEALIDRALDLDPAWNDAAVHSFLITYEMSRQEVGQDREAESRHHFAEAVRQSQGRLLAPYVSLAEAVSVQIQDVAEFRSLLNQALEIEIDEYPDARLVNLLMKKRALWLLDQTDELFLPELPEEEVPPNE